jgi:hypothetical protein
MLGRKKQVFILLCFNQGTHKTIKTQLAKEAYTVSLVKDDIYYFDVSENAYKPLTAQIYEKISNGVLNF